MDTVQSGTGPRLLRGGVNVYAFGMIPLLAALAACASTAPAPPPEPEIVAVDSTAAPEPEPFPFEIVWTAEPETALVRDTGAPLALPRPFTRLDVIGRDTIGLRVRCAICPEETEGYVSEEEIVFEYLPPEVAAWGTLAEFALSIREAATASNVEALRPAMAPDFSFSFLGPQHPAAAIDVWRSEQYATLSRIPDLLDQGLATSDGRIWSAPPAFVEDLHYRGTRIGFRQRDDGRWEWLYLISGIGQ